MDFNLKEFLNKKVMVKLFNGQIQIGIILRGPDEGLFRFQYYTVENKSDDSYSGYYEENMLLTRRYTSDGLYIPDRLYIHSDRWNIVEIKLAEELEMPITKPKFYNNLPPGDKTLYDVAEKEVSDQWANVLCDFIDNLGGDSPALRQWSGITPTPEKVVECLQELVDFHMSIAADNELDACCEWLKGIRGPMKITGIDDPFLVSVSLRNARRPQPTLKSQALKDFETIKKNSDVLPEILETVEKALQSIPE